MRRLLLSILCLVMALGLQAEDNRHKFISDSKCYLVDSKYYLVEKNKKWYEFLSDISIYEGSQTLEQTCCQLLGIDEQQTLQGYVEERLKSYSSQSPYSWKQHDQCKREGFVGKDYIQIGPIEQAIGNYQTYEVYRYYQERALEKDSRQWNFVYDMKNDKVLTVDDIFVPEIATMLKNNADGNYISIYVIKKSVSCGLSQADGTIAYETLDYVDNAANLTEQFKQEIAFNELMAEHERENEERQRELRVKQRQDSLRLDSLQKVKEEHLARTAYKRIENEFGELAVYPALSQTSDTTKTSKTKVTAGNNVLNYVLNTIKNEEGTTDSLWVKELNIPQNAGGQRPGVSKRMSYGQTKTETTTETPVHRLEQRDRYGNRNVISEYHGPSLTYTSGRWTTNFDIDIPANNPPFEQRLCKLIMNKSANQLEEAGKKFVKSFKGKKIGKKKANNITIRGRALSYNSGKYYSYAYTYTYSYYSFAYNSFFEDLFSNATSDKTPQVVESISKNIIYDIKNQKVLSLPDVLTQEEITNLGLKKKTKADLALDNYYLYVGVDGKPVCTYALCRDNWNKFTSVLQDLIAPYDSLPAKIDRTVFVFKDYEGIQPASISYKVNQEPSFRGHDDSLMVYLKSHIVLPDTMKSGHSWKVQFVVEKDGHLSHVETKADKDGEDDKAFASKLTEAFGQMPAWQPLELVGLGAQKTLVYQNVKFLPYSISEDDRIYDMVETNAQFPGGDEACFRWLSEHVEYPAICKEQGVQGRVMVSLVIGKDGSIEEAKTIRSPHPALSEEAERVVKMMPKWIPAMQGGNPVRSRFYQPIMFRLGSSNR